MAIKLPITNFQVLSASVSQTIGEQRVLLIGQMTSDGTATPSTLYRNIDNDASWDTLFGKKSQIARMVREFKKINTLSKVDAIPLADAGGSSPAVSTNIFTGTSSAAGTLSISVGSQNNNSYSIPVTASQSASTIVSACVTAINADTTTSVTASATNVNRTVNITSINRTLTTATVVTATDHGLINGDTVTISGADQAEYNVTATITYVDDTTFTYTVSGSPATPATGTIILTTLDLDSKALTLTAVNAGTEGNKINLSISGSITGITYTIAAFTSGATDPVLTGIPALITGIRYQGIVTLSSYTLTPVLTELQNRFNANNFVSEGSLFVHKTDSKANLVTYGNTYNYQSFTPFGHKAISNSNYIGASLNEFGYIIATHFAAVRALRMTDGANIAQYVIGSAYGAKDAYGGAHTASLPYFNTPMTLLPVIPNTYQWSDQELADLKAAGISCMENNIANTSILVGEVVTTYKTDVAGNPDVSFKYLEYVDTISNCVEYMFNSLKAENAQRRLTTGSVINGFSMANESVLIGQIKGYYNDLSELALVQQSPQYARSFSDSLTVTIDLANRKATISMILPIVTQLGAIDATVKMSFDQI